MNNRIRTTLLILTSIALTTAGWSQEPKKKATEKYAKDFGAMKARDEASPPPENCQLFVGSSSIRLWDLEKSWPELDTINNGFGGSTIAESIQYFDQVIKPYDAQTIVIYAGDNDIGKGLTADATFADFKKLAAMIRENTPDAKVVFIAIKPSIKRWNLWPDMKKANELIAGYCSNNAGFHFADIAAPMLDTPDKTPDPTLFKSDGLHLNDEGYLVWKKVIDPLLGKSSEN